MLQSKLTDVEPYAALFRNLVVAYFLMEAILEDLFQMCFTVSCSSFFVETSFVIAALSNLTALYCP